MPCSTHNQKSRSLFLYGILVEQSDLGVFESRIGKPPLQVLLLRFAKVWVVDVELIASFPTLEGDREVTVIFQVSDAQKVLNFADGVILRAHPGTYQTEVQASDVPLSHR